MDKRKILITVSEEQYKALEQEAKDRGLERVSTFIKSELVKMFFSNTDDDRDKKKVLIDVNNYRELSGYVEQKRFGSIASFATFAMESVMQRNQLTEAQKARAEKSIG